MTPEPTKRPMMWRGEYREVTPAAMVGAVLIGIVMNASITYAGLKIGFTITGSAIAAVLGFGILRGILRRGSVLETNIFQTVASAVNVPNSGVIFTVPVLILLGHSLTLASSDFWLVTIACVAGAVLGTVFVIPLRKQMIDIERLRFPSAMGVAIILKAPGAGVKRSIVLVAGIAVSALIFLPSGLAQLGLPGYAAFGNALFGAGQAILTDTTIDIGRVVGIPPQAQVVFALAPFALGAGFITGRPGLFVLAGGVLAYWVLAPLAFALNWMPETTTAAGATGYAFTALNRPLGIGLLLGGAMMGVLLSLPSIREAFKGLFAATGSRDRDELGFKPLAISAAVGLVLLFAAAQYVGGQPVNEVCPVTGGAVSPTDTRDFGGYTIAFSGADAAAAWDAGKSQEDRAAFLESIDASPGLLAGLPLVLRSAIIALAGALWIWFAGIIIAQCTGMTDWSPISGMALLTVVLILVLAGSAAVVGAVMIGAALCVAVTLASDMMSDLRTGHLLGSIPRRQQVAELSVVAIGPVVAMIVVLIIAQANVAQGGPALGPGAPNGAIAPQAQALQAVITGVQGGQMPYALYGFGALLGALLGLGAFSGLGVLIGLSMYLPFIYIATYGVGCVANMVVTRVKGRRWCEDWGIPFAAGLIVGESILALVINIIVLAKAGGS
jgi:uncharacterized oligopeptide transporter (OPT) family protein